MANPDIHTYGVATRFQPGESGNKKGRPKGSRSMSTKTEGSKTEGSNPKQGK